MTAPSPRWDLLEEHLESAAFLFGHWERALVDPEYALGEVLAGPEERLLAHLDALVLGGRRAAQKLLLPALAGEDAFACFAAAYALLASEDGDFTPAVLEALAAGEPEHVEARVRALQLAPRLDLGPALAAQLAGKAPAPALRVLAFRRMDPGSGFPLKALAASTEPAVRCALLRFAAVFPDRVPRELVADCVGAQDPAERAAALEAGLVLGLKAAWADCEKWVREGGAGWETAARAFALSGEADLAPLLRALEDPARRGAALFALGFTGRVAAADAAVALLADEDAGPLAGEAFCAVSGLTLQGRFQAQDEGWDPGAPEAEDDAPYGPEADLPSPMPEAVAAWWGNERKKLDPSQRVLGGRPWSLEGLAAALEDGPCRRREALALELAIRSRGAHQLETKASARRQRQELAELKGALRKGPGTFRELLESPPPRLPPVKPK